MLNSKECKLAVNFLHDFSCRLSNDGCNDWDFPEDWTPVEIYHFKLDICKWNGGNETPYDWTNVPNWMVAYVLAKKLEKEKD